MTKSYDIAVIAGDGVGPEVTREALRVLERVASIEGFTTRLSQYPFGAEHYLATREVFPDSAIAYRSGVFDHAVLNRFREGLEKADSTPTGRQLLILWQMTSFETVPPDYEKMLADIGKAYPPPKTTGTKKEKVNKLR